MRSGVESAIAEQRWNTGNTATVGSVATNLKGSELVVEAAGQALALLGGDLDVSRRQQVHAVSRRGALPARPGPSPLREGPQPGGDRVVGSLEVHDHGDPLAELVAEVAGL